MSQRIWDLYLIRKASNKNTKQENNAEWGGLWEGQGAQRGEAERPAGWEATSIFQQLAQLPRFVMPTYLNGKDQVAVRVRHATTFFNSESM